AGRQRGVADARLRRAEAARDRRGDRLAGGALAARDRGARRGGDRPHARIGAQVRRGPGGRARGRPGQARPMTDVGVETIELDLPPLAAGFARRPRAAGCPVPPARAVGFARALGLTRPVSRRRLYWTARSLFVSDQA